MISKKVIIWVSALLVTLILNNGYVTGSGGLADTPWPCGGRDPSNTRFSPYPMDEFHGTVLWTFDTGRSITSTPIIGTNNNIYVGSVNNNLYAISSSGMLRWYFTADSDIRSSPLLDTNGNIYFTSRNGVLYALDDNGQLDWSIDFPGRIDSHPVMGEDSTIYLASSKGFIYAIRSSRALELGGTVRWSFDTGKILYASPTIGADGTLYIGTGRDFHDDHSLLYAISPEGEELWSTPIPAVVTTPATLGSDGTIYFGTTEGYVFAVSSHGDILWSYGTEGRISTSPAVTPDGNIYFGSMDGHIYSIDASGNQRWRYETDGYIRASPGVSADGRIFIGSSDGNFYILDDDGELLRKVYLGSPVLSSASMDSGGTIYVGTNDGRLHAINRGLHPRPGPPLLPQAYLTEKNLVNISWEPPGIGEPTHYNIYRRTNETSEVYRSSVQSDRLYYVDHAIEKGNDYTYRISAENHLGESQPSELVTVSIPLEVVEEEGSLQLMIIIGIIAVLSAISIALTAKILRMKRATKMMFMDNLKRGDDLECPITCPFCGHHYLETRGKHIGRCPRCKSMIHPVVF